MKKRTRIIFPCLAALGAFFVLQDLKTPVNSARTTEAVERIKAMSLGMLQAVPGTSWNGLGSSGASIRCKGCHGRD